MKTLSLFNPLKVHTRNSSSATSQIFRHFFLSVIFILLTTPALMAQTWNGSVSNYWDDAANWTGGFPSNTADVLIPTGLANYPTLIMNVNAFDMLSLHVEPGANMIIPELLTINISGVPGNGQMTSLLLEGTATNNGELRVSSSLPTIDGITLEPGAQMFNQSNIEIGSTGMNNRGIILNGGTFNNQNDGDITIFNADNGAGIEVEGGATFNNLNTSNIFISDTNTSGIWNKGFFNNRSSSTITIGDSGMDILGQGILNAGNFFNYESANIKIKDASQNGIYNTGLFLNGTGTSSGEIEIDGVTLNGIHNVLNGNFTNQFSGSFIKIGQNEAIGSFGIINDVISTFMNSNSAEIDIDNATNGILNFHAFNNVDGSINIDNVAQNAINNSTNGVFTNSGPLSEIVIGETSTAILKGLFNNNGGSFVNTQEALLNIINAGLGIDNRNANSVVSNTLDGSILIGQNSAGIAGSISNVGLYNSDNAAFNNVASDVFIANTVNQGILNSATILNDETGASIIVRNTGSFSIQHTDGTILNDNCALIDIDNQLNSQSTFDNNAIFKTNYTGTNVIGSVKFDNAGGIVIDTNNSFLSNLVAHTINPNMIAPDGVLVTSTDAIHTINPTAVVINPVVLGDVAGSAYAPSVNWFTNPNMTNPVNGTYNGTTNIMTYVDPIMPTPSSTETLYFDVLNNGVSCGVQGSTSVQILAFPALSGGVIQLDENGNPVVNGGTIDTTLVDASNPFTLNNCSGQSAALTHVNNLSTNGVVVDENGSQLYTQLTITEVNEPLSATNPTVLNVPYVGTTYPISFPAMINTTNTTQTITFEAIPYFDTDNNTMLGTQDNTGTPVLFTALVAPTPTLTTSIVSTDICSGELLEVMVGTTVNEDITFDIVITENTASTDLDDDNTFPITISGTVNQNTSTFSSVINHLTGDFDLGMVDVSIENIQVASNTSCTAADIDLGSVDVHPNPLYDVADFSICSGETVDINVDLSNTNTAATTEGFPMTFTWTSNVTSGSATGNTNNSIDINTQADLANIDITDVLSNNGTLTSTVQYNTTLTTIDGCSATDLISVEVTPSATLTVFNYGTSTNAFCSGTMTQIDLTSDNNDVYVTWDADITANTILGAVDQTTPVLMTPNGIVDIAQVLTNTTGNSLNAVYTITSYINGCPGEITTATVTVHPQPDAHVFPIGNLDICVGQEGQVNALTNGLNYLWTVTSVDAGVTGTLQNGAATTTTLNVNNTSTIQNPLVSFDNAPLGSQAELTLVATDNNGCMSDPEAITLTSVGPGVEINGTDAITGVHSCEFSFGTGIAIVDLTTYEMSTSPGQITLWFIGDPANGGTQISNPSTVLLQSGQDLWVRVTNSANNCFVDYNVPQSILPLPATTTQPQSTSVCLGSDANFSTSSTTLGVTYQWQSSTDGFTFTNVTSNLSATTNNLVIENTTATNNNTFYRAVLTSPNGCSSNTNAATLTVWSLPTAEAGNDVSICPSLSTTLIATGGVSYVWSPTTGLASPTSATTTATPTSTTTYTVTVTDVNGCVSTDNVTVTIFDPAVANAGTDASICVGESTQLNGSGGVSYTWSQATNLNNENINNPIATPPVTETYTLSVADANGCTDTDNVTITVNDLPTIATQPSHLTICDGDVASFTVTPTTTVGTTYQWALSMDNGLNFTPINGATGQTYSTTNYSNGWDYNVVVTSGLGCSTTSDAANLSVNENPEGTISADFTSICDDESIELTYTSIVGDGDYTIVVNGVTYSNVASGDVFATFVEGVDFNGDITYTLTSIQDNGLTPSCVSTGTLSTVDIMVNNLPTLTDLTPGVCSYDLVNLSDYEGTNVGQIGASGGSWTTSTGAVVNDTNIGTVTNGESYTYTFMSSCMTSNVMATVTFTVNQPPIITTDVQSTEVCEGEVASFDFAPVIAGETYQWYVDVMTGNGYQGINGATNATYNTTNYANGWQYLVEVTSVEGCTTSSNPVTPAVITVNALPTVDAGLDQSICPTTSVNLGASGASTYTWTPAATLTNANTATPTATPTANTVYTVEGTDVNGCMDTDNVTISLFPTPAANAGSDAAICIGGSHQLSASGGVNYTWINTTTGLSNTGIQNPVATPVVTTTYTVQIEDANGCFDTDNVTITVNPLSTFAAYPADLSVCTGSLATFTAAASIPADIVTYQWQVSVNNGPFTDIVAPNLPTYETFSYADGNRYRVVITNMNGCVSNSGIAILTVNPLPTVSIVGSDNSGLASNDGAICLGDATTLTASGASTYLWNDTNASTTNVINLSPTVSTTYTVVGTDSNGCVNSESFTVNVNAPLSPSIATTDASGLPNDGTVCLGGDITLIASGSSSYLWNDGVTNAMNTVTPSSLIDTLFTVISIDANGCLGYDTVDVSINPLPEGAFTLSDTEICVGETVTLTFDGTTTPSNLLNLNGTTYTVVDETTPFLTLTPTQDMVFTSTQVTDANLCTNTLNQTATLTVNDLPSAWDPQIMVCNTTADYTVDLAFLETYNNTINTEANTTITWYLGQPSNGGVVISNTDMIDLLTNQMNVWVKIDNSLTNCSSELRATVTINSLPTVGITSVETSSLIDNDNIICSGDMITLTATGGTGFAWDDASSSTTASITVNPTVNTTYSVSVTNANGCVSTASYAVEVKPLPSGSFNLDPTTICVGDTVFATFAGTTVAPYEITFEEESVPSVYSNLNSGDTFAIFQPIVNSAYGLTQITDGFECTSLSTQMQDVIVNSLPVFNPGFEISACTNFASDYDLTGTNPGTGVITWFNDGVLINDPTDVDLTTIADGDLTVVITNTDGCDSTLVVPFTINPLPVISNQVFTICAETATNHDLTSHEPTATTGGVWSDAAGTVIVDPTMYTLTDGEILTYAYSDANTCVGEATYTFVYAPIPAGEIIAAPTTVCDGETVELSFDATNGFGPFDITVNGVVFTNVNDLGTFAIDVPTSADNTYTITQVTDLSNGCVNSTINNTTTVTVNPLPLVNNIGNVGPLSVGFSQPALNLFSSLSNPNTVFTWTIDELGTDPTGITAGTSTGVNPSIPGFTALPNTNTGINVTQVTVTAELNGCVGPPMVFLVYVDSAPYITNTDPALTDPCNCIGDGWFSEQVAVISSPGETWQVLESNLLDAVDGNPIAPGAFLTIVPLSNNDTTYVLNGFHNSDTGYFIVVESPDYPGFTDTLTNQCFYADADFNISEQYCDVSQSVDLLSSVYGDTLDQNPVIEFSINGNPATVFDPAQLGLGTHTVTMSYDAGTAAMNDYTDPGCLVEVSKDIDVVAIPSDFVMNCHAINVSLNENCEAVVHANMLLSGTDNFPCLDVFNVQLIDEDGVNLGDEVGYDQIGETLMAILTYMPNGNTCMTTVLVEDKMAPVVISCPNDTIFCYQDLNNVTIIEPVFEDNCSDLTPEYTDGPVYNYNCNTPQGQEFSGYFTRHWYVEDEAGYSTVCNQNVFLARPTIDDVDFPSDFNGMPGANPVLDCTDTNTGIDVTGEPSFDGAEIGSSCMYSYISQDILTLPIGCNGTKILREWIVMDNCRNTMVRDTQEIVVMDNLAPTFVTPADMIISADWNSCDVAVYPLPVIALEDNCSTDNTLTYFTTDPNVTIQNNIAFNLSGTTRVYFSVEDECNNMAIDSFDIEVQDLITPSMICNGQQVVALNNLGNAEVDAIDFDDSSYDNCGDIVLFEVRRMDDNCGDPDNLVFGPTVNFCCEDIGQEIMVVLKAYDAAGNSNTCMVSVIVQDKIAPVFNFCPANTSITCEQLDNLFSNPSDFGDATAVGSCSFEMLYSDSGMGLINECRVGTVVRTWTAYNDANANGIFDAGEYASTCSQTISVTYDSNYTVTFPADISLSFCDFNGVIGNINDVDISQNSCGSISPEIGVDVEGPFVIIGAECQSKYEVTYIVRDNCVFVATDPHTNEGTPVPGQANTFTDDGDGYFEYVQTITLTDPEAPNVPSTNTVNNYVDENCTSPFVDLSFTITDDCTASIDETFVAYEKFVIGQTTPFETGIGFGSDTYGVGNYRVDYSIQDSCGNQALRSTNINVLDTIAPVMVCPDTAPPFVYDPVTLLDSGSPVFVIPLSDMVNLSGFSATDNCGDPIISLSGDAFVDTLFLTCDFFGNPATGEVTYDGTMPIYVTDGYNHDTCNIRVVMNVNIMCGFTTPPSIQVSGAINTIEDINVNEAMVMAYSDENDGMDYTTEGEYMVEGFEDNCDLDITPFKNDEIRQGVNTFDLVVLSRHILETSLLDNPYYIVAGDINNSGSITGADVVLLRQLVLFNTEEFPNNTSWRFIPQNYEFPLGVDPLTTGFPESIVYNDVTSDMDGIDFVGVKIGDVDGSFTSVAGGIDTRSHYDGFIKVDIKDTDVQDEYLIDFVMDNTTPFVGMQFSANMNGMTILDINPTTGSNVKSSNIRFDNSDVLVSWNDARAIQNGEMIFTARVRSSRVPTADDILLTNKLNAEGYANNLDIYNLTISNKSTENKLAVLSQNRPNPFSVSTMIDYTIPYDSKVTMNIFDINGRSVYAQESMRTKGTYTIEINADDLPTNGVYYYQLETDTEVITKSLVFVAR